MFLPRLSAALGAAPFPFLTFAFVVTVARVPDGCACAGQSAHADHDLEPHA